MSDEPEQIKQLKRIADSLEKIEELTTRYFTIQSAPTGLVYVDDTEMTPRQYKKLKKRFAKKPDLKIPPPKKKVGF